MELTACCRACDDSARVGIDAAMGTFGGPREGKVGIKGPGEDR